MEIKDVKHFKGVPQEQLKAKVTELRKKHHPDKFHESKRVLQNSIMAEINAEYDFLTSLAANNPAFNKKQAFSSKFSQYEYRSDEDELKKQAQDIFNALHQKTIDYNSLISTINKVKAWTPLFEVYMKTYGTSMVFQILSKIKNKKNIDIILKVMDLPSVKDIDTMKEAATSILNSIISKF